MYVEPSTSCVTSRLTASVRVPPPCRVCLLECSVREVRVVVASILEKTLESALQFEDPGLDNLTDALLSLLDKDVPENVKNCAQYFGLFSNFAQRVMGAAEQLGAAQSQVLWPLSVVELRLESSSVLVQGCGPCQLLLKHSAYRRMLIFLLGSNRQNNQVKHFAFQRFGTAEFFFVLFPKVWGVL